MSYYSSSYGGGGSYGGSYGGGYGKSSFGGGRGGGPGGSLQEVRWTPELLNSLTRFEKDFYHEHPNVTRRSPVSLPSESYLLAM